MKQIYTFGGQPTQRNLTLPDIRAAKAAGRKLSQANALEVAEAAAVAASGVDMMSVTSLRYDEARAVAPHLYTIATIGAPHLVTADDVLREAYRVATAGADAIYTIRSLHIVEMLAREGLSVQGHVGLVPRKSIVTGGLRAMGKTADEALAILQDIRRLEEAGAVAVEVECVATEAMTEIARLTPLITHTIGSGSGGDVVFLFAADITGDTPSPARHARAFGDVRSIRHAMAAERERALTAYATAVRAGLFPDDAVNVAMAPGEHDRFRAALDRLRPVHQ
ncbi:MAG: 3-methyl-2-oxobutanoate hydroxymethyltransferase [Pseudorhodobacter sp.]|nr:3-methyl-2-oxobutanoate hydroxymethyltransferase [Pseudorhodobacter sp.]